jgi:hypothetical protein
MSPDQFSTYPIEVIQAPQMILERGQMRATAAENRDHLHDNWDEDRWLHAFEKNVCQRLKSGVGDEEN